MITGTEDCDCGGEACTAAGLNNLGCVDVSDPLVPGTLTGGTLDCNPASCKFNTSSCTWCGDGSINGNEACEPRITIGETCNSIGKAQAGYLTCDTACQYDVTGCTDCGATFDFTPSECSDAGWTHNRTVGAASLDTWECGEIGNYPAGPDDPKLGVWATNLSGPYDDDESGFLQSPIIDLTNCEGQTIALTLFHWYDFEGGVTNADGGILQVSNDGINWLTIAPTDGSLYVDANNGINASFPPVDGTDGFSGNSPDAAEWVESVFDVTKFTGSPTFRVRMLVGSDFASQQASQAPAGWYIDKFEVLGSGD